MDLLRNRVREYKTCCLRTSHLIQISCIYTLISPNGNNFLSFPSVVQYIVSGGSGGGVCVGVGGLWGPACVC